MNRTFDRMARTLTAGISMHAARATTLASIAVVVAAVASACSSSKQQHFEAPDGSMPSDDASVDSGDDSGDDAMNFGDGAMPDGEASAPPVCDPTCGQAGGTCNQGVCVISDNAGNLDPGTRAKLEGGGNGDPQFKWLYPYNDTVFPRGLLSPTLQFDGVAADAAYVHMTSATLDYKGYFKLSASMPTRIVLAQPKWDAVTHAVGAKDVLTVQVSKESGGTVAGPVKETWPIAQGSVRGTIYYETYDSQLQGGLGSVGIMQIQPGASKPTVLKTGCGNVCHTASADGSTLVAAVQLGTSASYDLKNGAATIRSQPDDSFTYGGLYPDGSILMAATNYRTWFGTQSHLYDAKTGSTIAAPGWDGVVTNAGCPTFSPDGKHIAFVHEDKDQGHTIATMGFNFGQKSFSGLVDLATDPNQYLGWPAFTPDAKWIVYQAGSNPQFETDSGASGDVYFVDVATKTTHRLDALDGYQPNGTTYLPANDPALSFAPTVLPEAVGGYYWVVFTSHRSYGNTLPTRDNNDEYGKLWVAALDLAPTAGKDASHPAFYLDGQETTADNLRGFWVLPPCKQNGKSCMSGDECCGGYCTGGVCGSMSGGCSHEYDKCQTSADCCDPGYQCINGRCAMPGTQ